MVDGLALKTQTFDFTMFTIVCAILIIIAVAAYFYAKKKMHKEGINQSNIKVKDKKMLNRATTIYIVVVDNEEYILTESSKNVSISKK